MPRLAWEEEDEEDLESRSSGMPGMREGSVGAGKGNGRGDGEKQGQKGRRAEGRIDRAGRRDKWCI